MKHGYLNSSLAGMGRLNYRIARWPLAEFKSVEVVMGVEYLVVGAHGFAEFVACGRVKIFNDVATCCCILDG